MKAFLFLIFVAGAGALGLYLYQIQPESAHTSQPSAAERSKFSDSARSAAHKAASMTHDMAVSASGAISGKFAAWHLTHDDIKADLAKTGQVARDKTTDAEKKLADARIVSVIKAKFVLDRQLSVHAIEVESSNGNVRLTGAVASEGLIGKAVAQALDTTGVHKVVATLTVSPPAAGNATGL